MKLEHLPKELIIHVQEFSSFEEAWQVADTTRESFEAFQGMKLKIGFIKGAQRWFVTPFRELWYSYFTSDGIRIVKKADVNSVLSSTPLQYVQIMVPGLDNPERRGKLRFTDTYYPKTGEGRQEAAHQCTLSEVIAFN